MNTRNTMISVALFVSIILSFWLGRQTTIEKHVQTPADMSERKVLYWYDPMAPTQHFDKPGKSPFMDMQLLPRYAGEGNSGSSGIRIDPRVAQNLGVRIATVERSVLNSTLDFDGTVTFNERDISIVQSRTSGFVERVHPHAPGDVVHREDPLADVLVPEWAGAQAEYLAVLKSGDEQLISATRSRLRLMGMPDSLIAKVQSSRQVSTTITIRSPRTGMINALNVRDGMTLNMGTPVASIYGLKTVWIEIAVPESQATQVFVNQTVSADIAAYPATVFKGKVSEILPDANTDTHTVRARVELNNVTGKLKPGMFARVHLKTPQHEPVLHVPSETVIHTGTRTIVLVVNDDGSYVPVEVQTGMETQEQTTILSGLHEGQRVVASGQFLIDSEANLNGVLNRMQPIPAVDNQERGNAP